MKDRKIFASIMLLSATLLWGFSYAFQSMMTDKAGSYTIVFIKGLGGVFLYPVLKLMKKSIDRTSLIGGLLVGSAAFLGCLFQQKGIELSTVSKASFITALYIVIVPLIEVFVMGKKLKFRFILAVATALAGLYFLCFTSSFTLSPGDLFLLIGSFFFALQIMFIDSYSAKCDPLVLSCTSQISVALLSGIMMLAKEDPSISELSTVMVPILFLLFGSGLIAQSIQTVFQKDVGPSLGSLLMSFESVFGALGGWLLLGQTLSIRELIGCVLVFVAVLLAE